jgi:glycosyltransferase involved in cell wall biosynthesis
MTAVFTVVAKNYLPYARVLMRSVAEHQPDWQRFVVLVDLVDECFDPHGEDFEIVLSRDLPIPEPRWFHFKYSILELSTAVKPYAFEALFDAHSFDRILYLDPDIKVYSPLDRVTQALDSANIVLTPHLTGALDDDRIPGEIDILRAGTYNLGFIGVRRSAESAAFLSWWRQKLYDRCVVDVARGLFVDQKWIDLVPGMFDGVSIVRDPGYNVAYWNLGHRVLSRSESGYEVAGSPLSFFHFSGYDPSQPEKLSRHQNRFLVQDLPEATQQLLLAYRDELLAAEYLTCQKWPYSFATFHNGVPIPDMGRPLHHEVPELVGSIEDPFSDEGFEAFVDVWNGPVEEGEGARSGISRLAYRIYSARADLQSGMPDIFGDNYSDDAFLATIRDAVRACQDYRDGGVRSERPALRPFHTDPLPASEGSDFRLTRLAAAIYQSRPELHRAFPDPYGRDRVRFLIWLLTYGRKEHQLSALQTAPIERQWRAVMSALPGPASRVRAELTRRGMAASLYARGLVGRIAGIARAWRATRRRQRAAPGRTASREFGVNLVGLFQAPTGVGQSAREAYGALRAAGVPTSLRSADDEPGAAMSTEFPYFANLFYVNADQTAATRQRLGKQFYAHRLNIGFWTWELDEFPNRWMSAFAPYREIWTPSSFCRKAVERKATVPVLMIPYAVSPVVPSGIDRQHFGLAQGQFIFLAAFDVLSVMERKNPLAAIRAFQLAFPEQSGCQLVLKANHGEAGPDSMEKLRNACGSSTAVRIIDATLGREEMYALIQCSDCFVSLHRSEGFGLVLAEAMYLGKPVIATGYSGNTDFTLRDNSLLVDYKMVPVGWDSAPYDPGSLWADPDVEQAASHMRSIAQSGDLRARLSDAGRAFVRANLSHEAVGQKMRQRLEALNHTDARSPGAGMRTDSGGAAVEPPRRRAAS